MHSCRIYARKCNIKNVAPKIKNEFLELNHIQGKDTSTISIGLYNNEELVAIACFKKTNIVKGGDGKMWELSRFCSKLNTRVIGAAGKLINEFNNSVNQNKLPLISYADKRWSTGALYETLGFKFIGSTPANYWYMSDYKVRKHRSSLMKHRLVECEEDKQLTEWQLAQKKGYDRIWDCGNTKWILA